MNRALPDTELDGFVDALARRIATFDHRAVRRRISNPFSGSPLGTFGATTDNGQSLYGSQRTWSA